MTTATKRASKTDTPAVHLRTLRAAVETIQVQQRGGRYRSGLIEGVSLIATGEALGHGLWIDDVTLSQVAEFANQGNKGLKSRFTHPGMSSDGLGRHLGRIEDSEVMGDKVVGNLHIQKSARKTPEGDLGDYVMSLVNEDSAAAGLSIVFDHDWEASDAFSEENMVDGEFVSPDPANVNNYPHVRIQGLRAADVVDEPAANPDGFFYRQDMPRQATAFLNYITGVSNDIPDETFGFDPERATVFLDRWLVASGLSIVPIAEDVTEMATETTPDTSPVEKAEVTRDEFTQELDRYVEAFGVANGIAWFREGLDYTEALGKHCESLTTKVRELTAENEQLKTDLENVSLGEDDAVEVRPESNTRTFAEYTASRN